MKCDAYKLGVANRDGDAYAVRAQDGRCFLVLEAETYHNKEVFDGLGSTEQTQITEAAFTALVASAVWSS